MATASQNIVSLQPNNTKWPRGGPKVIPVDLDFTSSGTLTFNWDHLLADGVIDFVQSIWIDNSDGTSTVDVYFDGAPRSQRIRVQPYSQGLFPVTCPAQSLRFRAVSSSGIIVPAILYNMPLAYYASGPADGALVVPALTNAAISFQPAANGNNQLVAANAAQSVKLYRALLTVDGPCALSFLDGPGGTPLTGPLTMYAGGSITLQPSGVPWLQTSAGNALVLKSTAAVNIGGQIGYIQS